MSRRRTAFCVIACCALLACGNTGASELDYGSLLQTLSTQVILPEHQAFAAQGDALVVAMQALSDDPSADSLSAAQGAWRDARKSYRVLDAVQIGPDLTSHVSDRIDVSPVDAGGIEAIVTSSAAVDDQAVANAGGKKKGFLGLEYLLFPDPSAAAGSDPPVLASDDSAARRRAYAISIADEIAKSAHQLDDAWEPTGSNFIEQVELAGKGGTQYATQRAAVDDLVSGGVASALETIVHNDLALPLGLKSGSVPAPDQDFTARSDGAVADMQATLSGIIAVYQDNGFSLVVRGKSKALDQTVQSEIADMSAKLDAISAPFTDALVNHTALVKDAYDSGRTLKATWDADVSSALGATLKPPDSDGD